MLQFDSLIHLQDSQTLETTVHYGDEFDSLIHLQDSQTDLPEKIRKIMWKERIEKNPAELERYCLEVLKLSNPDIRVRKILIQSLIKRNGYYMQITGKTGNQLYVRNTVSLCLKQEWVNYIKKLEKGNDENITKDKNLVLYDILVDKHNNTIYSQRPNPVGEKLVKRREEFINLNLNDVLFNIYWKLLTIYLYII